MLCIVVDLHDALCDSTLLFLLGFKAYPEKDQTEQPGKASQDAYQSIHDVDLRKVLHISAQGSFREKDPITEEYDRKDSGIHYERKLISIHYLPGPSQSEDAAVLILSYWLWEGASSQSGGLADVYGLNPAGQFRRIQRLGWGTHFSPPPGSHPVRLFDKRTNTLITQGENYAKGDAHCCPSSFDTRTYRWNGKRFVLVKSLNTKL